MRTSRVDSVDPRAARAVRVVVRGCEYGFPKRRFAVSVVSVSSPR